MVAHGRMMLRPGPIKRTQGMLFDIGFADDVLPVMAVPGTSRAERHPRRLIVGRHPARYGTSRPLLRLNFQEEGL